VLLICTVVNNCAVAECVFFCIAGSRLPTHPVLMPQDVALATVITEATVADIHRLQQRSIDCSDQLEIAQGEWVISTE